MLFLVDADAEACERIATALTRRFGADYEVRAAGTESEGLAMLEQLGNDGARVALIAADLALAGDEGGITFLERAHMSHPHASRVLLVAMDMRQLDLEKLASEMVIDGIIPEPVGGAQENHDEAARLLGAAVADALEELEDVPQDELRSKRRAKFRSIGVLA